MGYFRDSGRQTAPEWAGFFEDREYGEFLDHIDAYFREKGLSARVEDGVLDVTGDSPLARGQLGLQNLAQLCHQLPKEQWPSVVAGHFDSLEGGFAEERRLDHDAGEFERVRPMLKVRLFPADFLKDPNTAVVHRAWSEGVVQVLTFDLPRSVVTVTPEQRGGWKLSDTELFRIGLGNVRKGPRPHRTLEKLNHGVELEALHSDDFFTTSHALTLEDHLAGPAENGVLLGLPHRHVVLLHPIRDLSVIHAVNMMIPIIRGMYDEGPGSLSPHLYWWRDGGITHLPAAIEKNKLNFFPPDTFVEMMNALGK